MAGNYISFGPSYTPGTGGLRSKLYEGIHAVKGSAKNALEDSAKGMRALLSDAMGLIGQTYELQRHYNSVKKAFETAKSKKKKGKLVALGNQIKAKMNKGGKEISHIASKMTELMEGYNAAFEDKKTLFERNMNLVFDRRNPLYLSEKATWALGSKMLPQFGGNQMSIPLGQLFAANG